MWKMAFKNEGGEMMKLEQQVCNLELSKKLKELGVKQESIFYWRLDDSRLFQGEFYEDNIQYGITFCYDSSLGSLNPDTHISAFTVAELGEMLPREMRIECFKENWKQGYLDDTEANARAKMVIYLKEGK